MKASELRALLAQVDDNTEIVLPDRDHSYRPVRVAEQTKAERTQRGNYTEYYDRQNMTDAFTSIVVTVVVIS